MTSGIHAGQTSYEIAHSSLDNCAISPNAANNSKRKSGIGSWNQIRRSYRARDIMTAGIEKYKGNTDLKFLTLTSSSKADRTKLNDHCEELHRKIRKYKDYKAQFCKITTDEGNGVIHEMLATNVFIPQSWLSRQWNLIHGSPIVDIRKVYYGRGLRSYLTPYLQGQTVRLSQSWNWYRKGWSTRWRKFVTSHKTAYLFRIQRELGRRPPVYCYRCFQKWFFRSLIPVLFDWWLLTNKSDQPFPTDRSHEPLMDFKALMLEKRIEMGEPIIEGTNRRGLF